MGTKELKNDSSGKPDDQTGDDMYFGPKLVILFNKESDLNAKYDRWFLQFLRATVKLIRTDMRTITDTELDDVRRFALLEEQRRTKKPYKGFTQDIIDSLSFRASKLSLHPVETGQWERENFLVLLSSNIKKPVFVSLVATAEQVMRASACGMNPPEIAGTISKIIPKSPNYPQIIDIIDAGIIASNVGITPLSNNDIRFALDTLSQEFQSRGDFPNEAVMRSVAAMSCYQWAEYRRNIDPPLYTAVSTIFTYIWKPDEGINILRSQQYLPAIYR